jgi:hypothetical protein
VSHSKSAGFLVTVACLAMAGCSSDGDKRLVCPASGIGVTATTGENCATALAQNENSAASKDCLAQFTEYKKYDCVEPQITFDATKKRRLGEYLDPEAGFTDINWVITNAAGSPTGKKLHIKALGVAGDKDCFFSAAPDLEKNEIAAGGSASMRLQFKPRAVGEYHADVYVISDAQNFPKMILPVCVKVVPKPVTPEAGVNYDGGGKPDTAAKKDYSVTVTFDCLDVSTQCNDTCHSGCSSVIKM